MKGASHAKRIFTCFIVFAAWTIAASAQNDGGAYKMKTVVIDAGHGGQDPGNVGTGRHKKKEKDIALDVALRVGRFINEVFPDIKVLYTRDKDVFIGLNERADVANKADADLFMSIHCNAAKNTEAAGAETFTLGLHKNDENLQVAMKENQAIFLEDDYQTKYEGFDPNSPESIIALTIMQSAFLEQSLKISAFIQKQFKEKVGRKDRGVKQAGFLVLRRTTMPSILIELGFLTNKDEEDFLNSENGRIVMASAIFKGFKEYKERMEGGASAIPKETATKPEQESVAAEKPEEKPAMKQESAPKPAEKTPEVTKPAQETEAERIAKQKQLEAAKAEQAKLEQQKKDNEARKAAEATRLAAEKAAKEKALADAKRKAEEEEKAAQAERIHREAIAEQAKKEFATRLAEREKAKQDSTMKIHAEQRERRLQANEKQKSTVTQEQPVAKAQVPALSEKPLTPDEAELLYLEKRKLELEDRIARIKGTETATKEEPTKQEQTAKSETPVKAEKPIAVSEEKPVVKEKPVAQTPAAPPANVDKGVVLSVQIMTSPSKLDVNSARFKGEKAHYYMQDGVYKYVVGEWKSVQEATLQQRRLRQVGFDGAFVVAFKNGNRITLAEARELLNE
jgi:N-acetylmuramoyl-L-alanine amidase